MYRFLFIFAAFSVFPVQSQTAEEAQEALKGVSSVEQLDNLRKAHPDWKIGLKKTLSEGITFNAQLHDAAIGDMPVIYQSDSTVQYHHKILEKGYEDVCKVKYIYLDGKRRNLSDLNNLRAAIIRAYREGTSFQALVQKYSEDGNVNGELDWFYEGIMDPYFDAAVRDKPAGKIFLVDVPKRHWYYVVLKEEENKELPCTYSITITVRL